MICGGTNSSSIYSTGIVPSIYLFNKSQFYSDVIQDYTYIGCYADSLSNRDLKYVQAINPITTENCYLACMNKGFSYFATQYS